MILIVLISVIIGCGSAEKSQDNGSAEVSQSPFDSLVLTLEGTEGRTVFELTAEKYHLDYIESAVGNFIHAIDSIEISHEFGWLYSVNDTMATVASDKQVTRDGDIIKWHYRRF
jgi:hypothetical protein